MSDTGRLTAEARIAPADTDREQKALDTIRDEACELMFKSLVGTRVEIAEFEVAE